MSTYVGSVEGISGQNLRGFFAGWPDPPSPETHLKLLKNSRHVVLAKETDANDVVGFITAIGDGVLSAGSTKWKGRRSTRHVLPYLSVK